MIENTDGIKEPYIACGCCGEGLANNCLKARDPIWERCLDCIKIHGVEVQGLSALGPPNSAISSQPPLPGSDGLPAIDAALKDEV